MELEKLKSENAQLQKDLKYQTDQKFEYFLENIKLEKEHNDYKQQRDSLIKDVKQQRELLKDFSRFIHRKVEVCPGKKEYMDFRDRLKELGIRERE
ncbi:hypothetical protein [Mammaliicoccus sciuri]|uniref:hypothetical protein n=1 Tax=Mammaliicoccus sciuri TaxID=1296 RepID=UPI000D1EA67A|nr:hypothetical protein [Mammaliicoccus sciuri]PTJ70095.1 hypothetical protein BU008_10765 [Mammaliicoccus sciuri]